VEKCRFTAADSYPTDRCPTRAADRSAREANQHLGLPPEARDSGEAAACLAALGVRTVRLLMNNLHKPRSPRRSGIEVDDVIALRMPAPAKRSPHSRASLWR
jgi:GTP cyclohydrolase II